MATATKTNPALEAAEARIVELEARIEELQRVELSTTVWINDRITADKTKAGDPLVKFSAQKSVKNQDGGRVYGQYHNFVAYGPMAELFHELAAAGEKLVNITAFESPWSNGARKSDWVVTSITPFKRPEAGPAAEAAEPFSQDPTEEEILF
jgi:hypothetical protein